MGLKQRDLTRLTGATSVDVTNWRKRLELPLMRAGREREFGPEHEEAALAVGFLKALTAAGVDFDAAVDTARNLARKYAAGQHPHRWLVINPLNGSTYRGAELPPMGDLRERLRDGEDDGPHAPPLPAVALIVVDTRELFERIHDGVHDGEWTDPQ